MNRQRLELLPTILGKYENKFTINVENGTVEGLKPYLNHKGYLTINFWHEGGSKYYRVHELVAYKGGLNLLGNTVNHINGNKQDNRLCNLETVTARENHFLAKEKGIFKLGEENHTSKLREDQVMMIRKLYRGESGEQRRLAERFGVNQSTISNIINHKTWKHI